MDLSNCKLIESCNNSQSYKKQSIFPRKESKLPLVGKGSILKLRKTPGFTQSPSPSPSPIKLFNSSNPSQNKNYSLAMLNHDFLDLRVSCKRYNIPSISPSEMIKKKKSRNWSHKFVVTKVNAMHSDSSFNPTPISPNHYKNIFLPRNKTGKKDSFKELFSYQKLN